MNKTLIIGLGNPILGDDGVGWKVAERVRQRLESGAGDLRDLSDVDVNCVSLGGLSLMEQMVGYERVILVDSMQTGQGEAGVVRVFKLEELPNPFLGHSASTHDASLITALETGRKMGLKLPDEVIIIAVEAARVYDFSEELSPPIVSAVPKMVEAVLGVLK
jgi:hydrogenase maturation protease